MIDYKLKGMGVSPWAGRALGLALALGMSVSAACGPSSTAGDACNGLTSRCNGGAYQVCQNDVFVTEQQCGGQCVEGFGCGDCNPAVGTACSGNDVVECNADGTLGERVTTCAGGTVCSGGQCGDSCAATGTNLIYVVDTSYVLHSFDPSQIGTGAGPFATIGELDCPGAGFLDTPFSMSVDREGVAWILYSNGTLFNASIENAACSASGVASISGFDLYGMGFVTDAAGGDSEALWIASSTDGGCCGDLGVIRNGTMSSVAGISANANMSPELTGTGAGQLFAFFPDAGAAFVQELSKTTGAVVGTKYGIGSLGTGQVSAWAFAQWGGKFYIFVSLADDFGFPIQSLVGELDPETGDYETVVADTGFDVVGAGVSTCAPVGPS